MPVITTISIIILAYFVVANLMLAAVWGVFKKTGRAWQKHTVVFVFVPAMFCCFAAFQLLGLMVNFTPSLPIGIYAKSYAKDMRVGDLAAFCLDNQTYIRIARERGYLGAGRCFSGLKPLLKEIGGRAGDVIGFGPDGSITVNGGVVKDSAIAKVDLNGRTMPAIELTCGPIPDGKVFLISRHPGGFDSRYFGLVDENRLVKYRPIITF